MNRYPLPALIIAAAVMLALLVWTLAFADTPARLSPPEWPTSTPPPANGYPGPAPTADPYPAPYPGPAPVYLPVQMESYP